jgi:hypothetical protein
MDQENIMAATAEASESPQGSGAGRAAGTGLADKMRSGAEALAGQGLAKAGEFAETRKEDVAKQLDGVVEVIENFATAADAEFGETVGGAVRQGGAVVGRLAQDMRDTRVEDAVKASRTAIARNPGIAIALASLAGFLGGRIVKAGLTQAGLFTRISAKQQAGAVA